MLSMEKTLRVMNLCRNVVTNLGNNKPISTVDGAGLTVFLIVLKVRTQALVQQMEDLGGTQVKVLYVRQFFS